MGDRATKSPGVVRWLRPGHEPKRDTTNRTEAGKVLGERAKLLKTGKLAVLAEHSTYESEAQATHRREGEAGHHVVLDRKTGDTLRSPIVTPTLQRLAAQAVRDVDDLCANVMRRRYGKQNGWSAVATYRCSWLGRSPLNQHRPAVGGAVGEVIG
jgi:hypothetical protein